MERLAGWQKKKARGWILTHFYNNGNQSEGRECWVFLKNLLKVVSFIRVVNSTTLLDSWMACRLQNASLWLKGASVWFLELAGQCVWGKWMLALPSTARVKVSLIKALNPEIKVCTSMELRFWTDLYLRLWDLTWLCLTDKFKTWCILVISYPELLFFKQFVY